MSPIVNILLSILDLTFTLSASDAKLAALFTQHFDQWYPWMQSTYMYMLGAVTSCQKPEKRVATGNKSMHSLTWCGRIYREKKTRPITRCVFCWNRFICCVPSSMNRARPLCNYTFFFKIFRVSKFLPSRLHINRSVFSFGPAGLSRALMAVLGIHESTTPHGCHCIFHGSRFHQTQNLYSSLTMMDLPQW